MLLKIQNSEPLRSAGFGNRPNCLFRFVFHVVHPNKDKQANFTYENPRFDTPNRLKSFGFPTWARGFSFSDSGPSGTGISRAAPEVMCREEWTDLHKDTPQCAHDLGMVGSN